MPVCRPRTRFLALACLGLFCISANAWSQNKADARPFVHAQRLDSSKLPLSLVSNPSVDMAGRLQECERFYLRICATLGVSPQGGARLEIHWDDRGDGMRWIDTFPRSIARRDGEWFFTIRGDGDWNAGLEKLCRTMVICRLQALAMRNRDTLEGLEVPEPPLWLVEGLCQISLKEGHDEYVSAVWRFVLAKKVPDLKEVQSWVFLREDGIHRLWQQVFSFWLVNIATDTLAEKRAIQVYVTSLMDSPEQDYWENTGSNNRWWNKACQDLSKPQSAFYDWDQSNAHLNEATTMSLRYKGEDQNRLVNITELPKSTLAFEDLAPVQSAVTQLTELKLRGHVLMQPIAGYYLLALEAWSRQDLKNYAAALKMARQEQKRMDALFHFSSDYLDWFTVNYPVQVSSGYYKDYATKVEELERARQEYRKEQRSVTAQPDSAGN